MKINFTIRGRLGNAIFRYLACSILCIYYNFEYVINEHQNINCSDDDFCLITNNLNNKVIINSLNMTEYYQHDTIYKKNKDLLFEFIKKHPEHYILTDGVNAGDGRYEKYYMINILNTSPTFTKKYKNVLHLRLEDFVSLNLVLPFDRIIQLLEKNIVKDHLCIVCKKPETEFEKNYILIIVDYLTIKNINVIVENNDILTDYYIMKEAEILICSRSSLSWCAAFFSDKIIQCYLPDYEVQPNIMTCKYPIDNTIIY
uniref:Uncharacterized protein n=1 Tax=viral metagenome TaxID=1070528 RepID=A0A6C0JNI5_9ZZZZ